MTRPSEMPAIISRKDAKASGLVQFFTGVPCKRGHLENWSTSSGGCLGCIREGAQRRRGSDPKRLAQFAAIRAEIAANPPTGDNIISRPKAKALGLLRYFTGVRCVNGHLSERMTKSKKCVACHREARAIVRETRPTEVKAIKAASYLRHQAKVIAKVKVYQTANARAVAARTKRHREANKPIIAAKMKVWSKANRPLLRQHEANRRAREAGAEGTHTAAEVADLLLKQGHRCAGHGCGTSLHDGYHEDHIMPLAKKGTNWISNIQLLCRPCNQSKHARDPFEWAQMHGRLL
jgi:hypothetical protein